jgi:hypothetical protein
MFAAAMLYSTPNLELSIYSTCQRISQKLMRNVTKFLGLIYDELQTPRMPVVRSNMEEVVLQGPDSTQDIRIVNSYPSQVKNTHLLINEQGKHLLTFKTYHPKFFCTQTEQQQLSPQDQHFWDQQIRPLESLAESGQPSPE